MKVLVTGADGFIGSHLTEALVRRGYSVKAFVLYNSLGSRGWLDKCSEEVRGNFDVFSGDIRDPHGVRAAMVGCDLVLHLAALIAIPFSYYSPDSYVDTNIKGTLNVLQAARKLDVSRVVHTSTSEVYGSAKFTPITESHPLQGQSPYSATKIAADQLAFSFNTSFDLPVVIARPFNTYGPRQSARAVIPTIITQLLSGAPSIKLGALYPTRDFCYVDDTVAGFISLLEGTGNYGQVVNFGSGFEISIGGLFDLICEIVGVRVEILADQIRQRPELSEVDRLWCDNSKALNLLGWSPRYAGVDGLRRGLSETISWLSDYNNLKLYRSDIYNI